MSENANPAQPDQSANAQAEKPKSETVSDLKPKKLELTEDEFNAKIDQARKDALAEVERKAAEANAASEADAAKKKGEFEALYTAEQARAKELEAKIAERDHRDAVRDAVAKAGKGHEGYDSALFQTYVGERLLATLAPGAAPDDITKAAKAGVEQYVKDNPRDKPRTFNPNSNTTSVRPAQPANGTPHLSRLSSM